jgi:hypothetical protein
MPCADVQPNKPQESMPRRGVNRQRQLRLHRPRANANRPQTVGADSNKLPLTS